MLSRFLSAHAAARSLMRGGTTTVHVPLDEDRMPINRTTNPRRRYAPTLPAAILLAASAAGGSVHAQAVAPPLWTRDSIHSKVLGETRVLRIALPVRYGTPEYASERYPVLIMLGTGDVGFAAAVANARALGGTNAPAIPHLIIVGVETPNAVFFRDMTPPPAGDTAKRADGGGGAPAFLRFLSTELRPYIAARYRTQSATILAGHSLTGFFAAWAFGQAPDFLLGAIALSPSALAVQQVLDGITARTTPGRLFMLTGTSEIYLDSATQSFAAALNARPAPRRVFEHQRIPEVSHDHTGSLGMVPGLRFMFRPVSLAGYQLEFSDDDRPMAKFSAVFDSTREAYMRGARELGLPERLPLGFLMGQSRWYQSPGMAPLLLRLCQELITSYPTLSTGYDCAGDAQLRLGRAADAAASYRRAIEAARTAGDSATAGRIAHKAEGRLVPPS
jgi:uncharacterized protein